MESRSFSPLVRRSVRVGAEEADHDALDDQFLGGQKVGVARVFGAEERLAVLEHVAFQRRFAVDQGGNDVLGAWFARGEEDGVAVEDARVDHRVAAYAQGEEFRGGPYAERHGVDGDVAVGLRDLRCDAEAGGDGAEARDLGEGAAARVRLG